MANSSSAEMGDWVEGEWIVEGEGVLCAQRGVWDQSPALRPNPNLQPGWPYASCSELHL